MLVDSELPNIPVTRNNEHSPVRVKLQLERHLAWELIRVSNFTVGGGNKVDGYIKFRKINCLLIN